MGIYLYSGFESYNKWLSLSFGLLLTLQVQHYTTNVSLLIRHPEGLLVELTTYVQTKTPKVSGLHAYEPPCPTKLVHREVVASSF